MADSDEEVMDFLRQLAKRAKPFAERDLTELKEFAKIELGLTDLQPWDIPYASERLREMRYAYSEDEVKQYFTEPRVLSGLFEVIETLFGVRLTPFQMNGWHEDVRAATVQNQSGEVLGYLILDLYARPGKQPPGRRFGAPCAHPAKTCRRAARVTAWRTIEDHPRGRRHDRTHGAGRGGLLLPGCRQVHQRGHARRGVADPHAAKGTACATGARRVQADPPWHHR